MEKKQNIEVVDNIEEPKYINTFKMGYTEGSINIDFANLIPVDEENAKLNVIAKIIISESRIFPLLKALLQAVLDYEKEYNKQIIPKQQEDVKE